MDTKKLRQKILNLAIHGKLVPQDPNDEPASVLLERIRAEKERLIKEGKIKRSRKTAKTSDTPHYPQDVPFEVPEGWVWTTLGEIGTWQSGATPSRLRKDYYGGNIPWLKTGDLNDGLITDIPEFITQKAFIAMGGGGAQPNISKEKIAVTFMPLPPLTEQQRIVVEIERWFKLIDAIDQSKADLQTTITQTKSKILDLAIHGKLVPQDPSDEPASELLKRINPKAQITCDNEHYPQLPKGWSITSMQEVCGLFDGERQEDRLLTNLDAKFLRGFSDGKVIKAGRYVPANTYMILVDGENSGEVFQTSTEGYQGSTFKQLNINENMNEKFVLHIINLHRKSLRENKVGSAIPHLNKKLFKAIPVPIPPYAEQERIIHAINAAYALLTVIEENL